MKSFAFSEQPISVYEGAVTILAELQAYVNRSEDVAANSLDTLDERNFRRIARRPGLDRVLSGIAAAQRAGFAQIRLNAVAIRGLSEQELVPLVRFAVVPVPASTHGATGRKHQFCVGTVPPVPRGVPPQERTRVRPARGLFRWQICVFGRTCRCKFRTC